MKAGLAAEQAELCSGEALARYPSQLNQDRISPRNRARQPPEPVLFPWTAPRYGPCLGAQQ
jgi:hypothetical protein